ncbi:MAG: hypothetical protein BLITH_0754 [Brockia lithotrophica]|uniref:Uncharacterized protein n=1 Tax=Brockia lithotrophica TaxID=933949 RepID=A0A2T5G8R5_9BACL|nr:MAG: hypothetical protein BLITH_0754 [Brockia lithotrophica]
MYHILKESIPFGSGRLPVETTARKHLGLDLTDGGVWRRGGAARRPPRGGLPRRSTVKHFSREDRVF